MFVFKKIVSAFLLPIPIGLFLLFLSFIYLMFNSYKKAKVFLFLGLSWFVLLSFQPISNAILAPLENSHKALIETPKVNYILVLGSGHKSDENLSITSQVKMTAINRLVEGIRHYKNLENAKLIVSGYSFSDKNSHAFMQEQLAISLGVKKEDIIRLDTTKDTKEEAVETKKIVGTEPLILVTSASHMKRSVLLFEKEGLKIIASPTNHMAYEDDSYSSYFSAKNLRKCEIAIHEYLGLVYSWLRDEI
ncbi:MAG: ElyC/SanA/YdcF family protein [Arcobacter sp.]|uniref:ElyC/SanA/YdcF family protein n=1 Tax=Arcobacter sp. TaxID=1872629 RepID=UPI0025851024|nr:ElyC/SanA/YdcF family protein [Arcobacter sp.]MDD3008957.1 ElyC/SanA/YdcF family protein [Arcobacter sp.]